MTGLTGLAALVRRWGEPLIAIAAAAVAVILLWAGPRLTGLGQWVGAGCIVTGWVLLAGWRRYPGFVSVAGPLLILSTLWIGPEPSTVLLILLMGYAAVLAEHFGGRAAWLAGAGFAAYLLTIYAASGEWGSPGLAMLTVPGFVAGTALRLRRETSEELAERGREIDAERELFAQLSVRNERARIASELHDIVGHALSVMVVQAAAGQRLAASSPALAAQALEVIAASARQGRDDLHRLVELLAGTSVHSPDLTLIDEVVAQAARSGLDVSCRFEGDRSGVSPEVAHVAFRVVQESLTNALRYAPGAPVRILVREEDGRGITVQVENDAPPDEAGDAGQLGGGRGLGGLRERVLALGGAFSAGPGRAGGWHVHAQINA